MAGVRDGERGLARRRRRCSRSPRRRWPWALGAVAANHAVAHRRRPLAALALARQQLDAPAGARGGAARDRDHDRRRSRSGGDARRARPARRARRAGDLLLHRRAGARPPCPVPRDRRAAATACRTTAIATRTASRCSGRKAMAREIAAAQATLADITGERAALLPRPGRAAQSVPRAGAAAPRPAARQLDPARLRHRAARADRRAGAPRARPRRRRHPARCTTATRRAPTTARRSSSPCCRRCWRAPQPLGLRRGDAARGVAARSAATTPRRRPKPRERIAMSSADAALDWRALVDGGERARISAPAASPGTSRAASCAGIRSSAISSRAA